MHDPMTVAFDIKRPWPRRRTDFDRAHGWRYWPSLVTVWHVDPEIGGSDDSCGFSYARLTKAQIERARKLGHEQFRGLFAYQCALQEHASYIAVCHDLAPHEVIHWAWRRLKQDATPTWRRRIWQYDARLSRREQESIWSLACSPVDNLKHTIGAVRTADDCAELFVCIERVRLTRARPWYRRPRWHVHHWQFQIHATQAFKRWAFSRCAGCGKGFQWGYSPVTFQWNSDGPRWFRSETGKYHHQCCPSPKQ